MRVGIVWNHPSALGECSFRFESYLRGLERCGHEGIVVCAEVSNRGLDVPRVAVDDEAALENVDRWRSLGLDAALVVTWHRMSRVLGALRAAGVATVSISDSDGLVGYRDHPLSNLRRLLVYATSLRKKARVLRFWIRELRRSLLGRSELEDEIVASTRASDVVIQGHLRSRLHFQEFLRRRGEAELARRVQVAPFAVAAPFLSAPIAAERPERVIAVGRWSDPQKDAPLLARVLRGFLEARPSAELVLVGEPDPALAGLIAHPRVRSLGRVPFDVLASELTLSRIHFSASRWEGTPHAALEAMASGVTLVGPPIPCFQSWARDEDFGTVARRRSYRGLLDALLAEADRWRSGDRKAGAISRRWRRRLDPRTLCREMLEGALAG